MENKIELHGIFNEKGELHTYGNELLQDLALKNKGKTVLVTVRVYEKGASPSFIGFYRNKFLPDIQSAYLSKGILKSLDEIDKNLRGICPITYREIYNEKKRGYEKNIIDLEDLEKWQLVVFIDYFLRPWAAENLQVRIDSSLVL